MPCDFENKLKQFEENKKQCDANFPIRVNQNEPKIPQITPKTRRFLKLKSLLYILKEDHAVQFDLVEL